MQITLMELIGFFGIIASIATGVWVISGRFGTIENRLGTLENRLGTLEGRVGRLQEKVDEILVFLRHKKKKHAYRKH